MRWDTHVLCGISSLWLLAIIPRETEPVVWMLSVVSTAFGALLPDLDSSESKIKYLTVAGVKTFTLPAMALHGSSDSCALVALADRFGTHPGLCKPFSSGCIYTLWHSTTLSSSPALSSAAAATAFNHGFNHRRFGIIYVCSPGCAPYLTNSVEIEEDTG